jgi:hypothetical protein
MRNFDFMAGRSLYRSEAGGNNPEAGLIGLSRNPMNYSFKCSDLVKADGRPFYPRIALAERSRHGPSLIPSGDTYNSRGQRPWKKRSHEGLALKGSNPCAPHAELAFPRPRGVRPLQGRRAKRLAFRGRCPRLLACALTGHGKPPPHCESREAGNRE